MDRRKEICDWFRKLGYNGDFPEKFDRVYTNSTSFIWDQILENPKTKTEVNHIKDNILIARLSNTTKKKEGDFLYHVEEIDLHLRKTSLEKDLSDSMYSLSEKQKTNLQLIQQNKIKCFSIEKINSKIKQNEEREYLLREKLKILEKDSQDAENILDFPITSSLGDQDSSKDITLNLEECEETLQKEIKQFPLPLNNSSSNNASRLIFSTRKTAKKNNVFEEYLCSTRTKTKTSNKIERFYENKENVGTKVNVRLFTDENISEIDVGDEYNDNFFVDINKVSFLPSNNELPKMTSTEKKMENRRFKRNENISIRQESGASMIKKIFSESVSNEIRDLLYRYSRQSVWNSFQALDDILYFSIHISSSISLDNICHAKHRRNVDLTELHSIHVHEEIKRLKNDLLLKQLNKKLIMKKENVNNILVNSGYPSDIIRNLQSNLQLQIEDVGLNSLLEEMKKEINMTRKSAEISSSSEIKKKSLEIKKAIIQKINSLFQYLDIIQDIFVSINSTRCTTSSCVRKLATFSADLDWCNLLELNINSQEILTFEEFSLENNRKCINTNPSVYYKDICADKFLYYMELSDKTLMLSNILESPYSVAETVILNILRAKCKLGALKSIRLTEDVKYNKCSLKELREQESYMGHILEGFNNLLRSPSAKRTLSVSNLTKKIMELWLEMPFKDFISPNRTCDDKDYKHYENLFDYYNL